MADIAAATVVVAAVTVVVAAVTVVVRLYLLANVNY